MYVRTIRLLRCTSSFTSLFQRSPSTSITRSPCTPYLNLRASPPFSCAAFVLSDRRLLATVPNASETSEASSDLDVVENAVSFYDSVALSASHYLQTFHHSVSFDILPWSATLPLAALSLRLVTIPLVHYSQLHTARAALASREIPRIHYFVRNTPGTLVQKYWTFRRLRSLTLRAAGTSSILQFPWHIAMHIPLFVSASMGVRELAFNAPDEWHTSGLPFAPDLSTADPTGALPLVTTALWLWNLNPSGISRRRAAQAMSNHQTPRSQIVDTFINTVGDTFTVILQMLAVLSLMYTTHLPSGLVLFWTSNAVITILQRLLFSSDTVRRRLGLPTYADIANAPDAGLTSAIGQSVEAIRKELSYIQRRMLELYPNRKADEQLCADVNRMLQRERWNGRVAADLHAELRTGEQDGRPYVAIVHKNNINT